MSVALTLGLALAHTACGADEGGDTGGGVGSSADVAAQGDGSGTVGDGLSSDGGDGGDGLGDSGGAGPVSDAQTGDAASDAASDAAADTGLDTGADGGPADGQGDVAGTDAAGTDAAATDAAAADATASDAVGTDASDGSGADGGATDAGAPLPCSATGALWDQLLSHAAGAPLRVAGMADGGLAVATSGQGQAEILRRSSTGSAAWNHTFKPTQGAQANALVGVAGGGLWVAGQRGGAAKPKGWLAALDVKGQVLWQQVVQYAEVFNGSTQISDGPLVDLTFVAGKPVAVGHHPALGGSGKTQSALVWLDDKGNTTAKDGIYLGGSTRAAALAPWEQGGVVVAGIGYSNSADGDVFVTTWVAPGKAGGTHGIVQVFPTAGQEQVTGVASLGQGRVAVAGQRTLGGKTSLLLMLFDGTGKGVTYVESVWNKAPATAAHSMWLSSAGDLLVAAEAAPQGGLQGPKSESWLLGIGRGGGLVWERGLGDSTVADHLADGAALADDKLVLVGAAGGMLRALRTSPWGHASCTAAGKCAAESLQSCADKNVCTAPLCDAAAGCQAPAHSDGTFCPAGVCKAGVCGP